MNDDARVPVGQILNEFLQDAQECDDAAFKQRRGPAFLLLHRGDFRRPRGPQQTGVFHAPGPDLTADVTPIAFPIRRKPTSEFAFVSVGRVANNDVHLPDETISKFHAYFKEEGDKLFLQDGRSRNGTFLNGERVAARGEGPPVEVGNGAVVRFGTISATLLQASSFRRYVLDVAKRG